MDFKNMGYSSEYISTKIKTTVTSVWFVLFLILTIAVGNYVFSVSLFISHHAEIAQKIHDDFRENLKLDNIYVTDNKIFMFNHEQKKYYEVSHSQVIQIEDIDKNQLRKGINVPLKRNLSILIPQNIVVFEFNNVSVGLDVSHTLYLTIAYIVLVIFSIIILYLFFNLSMKNKNTKIENLTISTQQYVLSERTISYLVSIIHHKLNTPLKILVTKTRLLIETIAINDDIEKNTKDKAEVNYVHIDNALKSIFAITNKLKAYNELSQNESNIYKLCTISKETMDILKDDEFTVEIDYKTKLYEIDKSKVSSHEIIQIFINQIKFSLLQLADKVTFKIFQSSNGYIKILYTDNGNMIEDELKEIIDAGIIVSELKESIEGAYFDLLLNFNILNANPHCGIKILSSNKNGNVFELKLPVFKESYDELKTNKAG